MSEEGQETIFTASHWRETKRRLQLDSLEEQVVSDQPPVTEKAIRDWLEDSRPVVEGPRRLRLRSLQFKSREEAERVVEKELCEECE